MSGRPTRALQAFAAAALVGGGLEAVRVVPAAPPGSGAVLALLVVALTALWAAAIAAAVLLGGAAVARTWPRDAAGRLDVAALPLLGPAAWLALTGAERAQTVAAGAFVRQDLAAGVVPVATLAIFAAVGLGVAAAARALGPWLRALRRAVVLVASAVLGVLALAAHLARFPTIVDDALAPVALQLALAALAAAATLALPARWRRPRRGGVALAGVAALLAGAVVAAVLAPSWAPRAQPAAAATLAARGLAAGRLAPRLAAALGVGDADRDGHRADAGDCDDRDPRVHPYAVDVPDDGVDQDCEGGDLLAADRARPAPPPPGPARARNLLLVTIDALRGDAPSFAGGAGPGTPTIDALAARGAVFTRAYAHAPMTRRSFPALLASRYPSNVHWMDLRTKYPYTVSHDDNLFLAELLRDAGLATASVVAFGYARNSRFNQGWTDQVIHPASASPREVNADKIATAGIAKLRAWAADAARPRFALWLHFYDAHLPYVHHAGLTVGTGERDRYQGEVAWIDAQLARVTAALDELGLAADTLVALTGDHGEEFGEHGGTAHGDLYLEDLHVPLVLAGPGVPAGRHATPVGLVDLAPTAAALLGVAVPPAFDGTSRVPWLDGAPPPDDAAVMAELLPDRKVPRRAFTWITAGWQLIVDPIAGTRELFDLATDPRGQRNVAAAEPARADALELELRRHLARRHGEIVVSIATPAQARGAGWDTSGGD